MNTVKFDKNNVKVIAHRGLSGIEKENTCSAFVAAGNRSYYGVETDIHRTADGKFVINHDNDVFRATGEKINTTDASLAVFESLVVFDRDGTKERNDLRLCSLENYLKICKKYEKHCVIELKTHFTDEEIARIIDIIKSYDYIDSVTFISFCYENLTKVRSILPEQSVQFLFFEPSDEIFENMVKDKIDVDIFHAKLTKELLDKYHESGLKVNCFTVDKKEDAEKYAEWGVDFITTNILE